MGEASARVLSGNQHDLLDLLHLARGFLAQFETKPHVLNHVLLIKHSIHHCGGTKFTVEPYQNKPKNEEITGKPGSDLQPTMDSICRIPRSKTPKNI